MGNKVALIVGRFQPFHKGHLFLIKKALEKADKIIIGIGSANITDENNPIDFETRRQIIKAVAYKEKFEERLIKIVPLDDFFDDKKWLENLEKQVGEFDLAVGNNQWTNNILKKAGYKVLEVDYYNRGLYEGWRIRKLIKEGRNPTLLKLRRARWQDRVPNYIVKWLNGYMVEKNNLTIQQFNHVIFGGTFDHFHKGHEALLTKAIEVGKKITVGIAMEEIYKNKFLSKTVEPFKVRKKSVSEFLKKKNWFSRVKFISFSQFTGGAEKNSDIDAIIVSKRTYPNALKINQMREENHLPAMKIVVIPDVLGEDKKLISSERIRAGEINKNGLMYRLPTINYKLQTSLKMPENLREKLRKPLGLIFKDEKALLRYVNTTKHTLIIAIGDIIINSLMEKRFDPDVKIIDFRSRRKKVNLFAQHPFAKKSPPFKNNPGTINLKTAEKLKRMIRSRSVPNKDGSNNSWLVIEGDEDLLALPAILFAPLYSLVLYGHWQHGVIAVEATENIKNKVKKIINQFD